jgi:hypothetical protein
MNQDSIPHQDRFANNVGFSIQRETTKSPWNVLVQKDIKALLQKQGLHGPSAVLWACPMIRPK